LTYVPAEERRVASRASQLTVERVPPGPWHPVSRGTPRWGFLIVDGMMAREVVVAGAAAAELLGAGDVIVPRPSPADELVPSEAGCQGPGGTRSTVSWLARDAARRSSAGT
jgi:hypothetical protein